MTLTDQIRFFLHIVGDVVQNLLKFHRRLVDFNNMHSVNVAAARDKFRSSVIEWHLQHKLLLVS